MLDAVWIVWAAYYSEMATVGIVEAATSEAACEKFWTEQGDGNWPASGVHAHPIEAGFVVNIDAPH